MAIETSDSVTTIRRERLIVVPLFIARRVVAERECRTRWWETLREIYGIGSGPTTVPRSDDGGRLTRCVRRGRRARRSEPGGAQTPAGPGGRFSRGSSVGAEA